MKGVAGVTLALLVIMATCLVILAISAVRPANYEYAVIGIPDSQFQVAMGQIGSQGWEISSARRANTTDYSANGTMVYEIILSRRLHPFIQPPSMAALASVVTAADNAERARLKAEEAKFQ